MSVTIVNLKLGLQPLVFIILLLEESFDPFKLSFKVFELFGIFTCFARFFGELLYLRKGFVTLSDSFIEFLLNTCQSLASLFQLRLQRLLLFLELFGGIRDHLLNGFLNAVQQRFELLREKLKYGGSITISGQASLGHRMEIKPFEARGELLRVILVVTLWVTRVVIAHHESFLDARGDSLALTAKRPHWGLHLYSNSFTEPARTRPLRRRVRPSTL
ncbi:hypothetical protein D3C76_1178280 [compost metagenome]